MNEIPERLDKVRQRIATAATASGRDPDEVRLLAVSKTKPVAQLMAAHRAGQHAFGENYLQDALPKISALTDANIEWHFIGRIQSNKTAEISRHFAWVHGLEQIKHAQRLSTQRATTQEPLQVCLQVNLSGQASKGGVTPEALPKLAQAVSMLPGLSLRGLMTLPDPESSPQAQRQVFARLRSLLCEMQGLGLALDTLSMGMSADLEDAVAEGATIVRVGSDIFGPRD